MVLPAFRQCNFSISAPCGDIFHGKRYVCNLVSITNYRVRPHSWLLIYHIKYIIYTYTRPHCLVLYCVEKSKDKQPCEFICTNENTVRKTFINKSIFYNNINICLVFCLCHISQLIALIIVLKVKIPMFA